MITEIIIGSIVLIGGLGYMIYKHNYKPSIYTNLKHCDVPVEWRQIRYNAWVKASNILSMNNITPQTRCKKIKITKGIDFNLKTKQWGTVTKMNGKDFWYAGRSTPTSIEIVGDPNGLPYNKSEGIFAHETAETILDTNPYWSKKNIDERNKFLWSLGL